MPTAVGEFKWNRYGELSYLSLPEWEQRAGVLAAFSTRHGGLSQGALAGLNLGPGSGDEGWRVQVNRRRFTEALGISGYPILYGRQMHGTEITYVSREDARALGPGFNEVARCDGLITAEPGLGLAAFFADCVPLFFADPRGRAIGLVHAGWRGSIAGIGPKMVRSLASSCDSRPEALLVAMGPSIGPCCYQVGPEVAKGVQALGDWTGLTLRRQTENRWFLDLWALNRGLLERSGVLPRHILEPGLCTRCRNNEFFSYRAQGGRTGSLAAVMMLKPKQV